MNKTDILIIEDDENISDMYRTALEIAGLSVSVANNAKEGIDKALSEHPKVILMDIMLPDMKGHEAVEKIKLDDWGKNVKVIFLTNMIDAENVSKAVSLGSEEYIVKVHTTPKEVVNIVRTAMFTD
ncbi:MAG: response regulator [Gelidibacter sp.]|nr:response regulator [Gelidibacter sp.]